VRSMTLLILIAAFVFFVGTPEIALAASTGLEGTAGIQAVDTEEFTGKVSTTINKLYDASKPIVDGIAVIALCVVGISAMFVIIGHKEMPGRLLGAVFALESPGPTKLPPGCLLLCFVLLQIAEKSPGPLGAGPGDTYFQELGL
jgi:hypothetical protein